MVMCRTTTTTKTKKNETKQNKINGQMTKKGTSWNDDQLLFWFASLTLT